MQKMFKIIFVMTLALVSLEAWAANIPDTTAETVRLTISELVTQNQIPGVAVEVYINGKPYSYYYGFAKPQKKIPVTDKTIFEIGSISKVMTSFLLAQEIDVAKMGLNDSLDKYIKNLPDSFDDVSLLDLATHTSGLPFLPPKDVVTRAQLNSYLATWAPQVDAGEQYEYSNLGMGLLGYALERRTHTPYNQLYRSHLAAKLGMQPIGAIVPAYLQHFYAQGFDNDGNPVQTQFGIFPAAGAIKASAHDMQIFLAAAIGLPGTPQRILYPMRMTQAAYVRIPDCLQGLGWQIHQFTPENASRLLNVSDDNDNGPYKVQEKLEKPLFYTNALIDKTGGTDGFRAYIAVLPDKKSGIVILSNKFVPKSAIVTAGRQILFKLNNIGQHNKIPPLAKN